MKRLISVLLTIASAQAFSNAPKSFVARQNKIAQQGTTTSLNLFDFFSKDGKEKREEEKRKRRDEEEASLLAIRARRRDPDKMEEYFDKVIEDRKQMNKDIAQEQNENAEEGF
jgi:hypothetical protein